MYNLNPMLSIIACISKGNRAIGYNNQLLYHIKEDMVRFKELTIGHTIIMGRKTYESLPHGALPKRRNLVVSKTLREIPGCEVVSSIEEAWKAEGEEIFVIGGESIYRQAIPLADKLYLTIVDDEPQQADTFFPSFNLEDWEMAKKEMRNENSLSFTFLTYVKTYRA